jgi:hypothetical protein
MSGTVRSQRLFSFACTAAGQTGSFGCPDDHVTLVKSAHFYNPGPTAANVALFVQINPGGINVYLKIAQVESGATDEWNGWLAMNPTDAIVAVLFEVGMTCVVSGAVLAGPPPFPPSVQVLPASEPYR